MPHNYINVAGGSPPASLFHYSRLHNLDPRWVAMNIPLLWQGFYFRREECDVTLDAGLWTTTADTGGTAFALNAQRGAAFRGATGTTDNNGVHIRMANAIFDAADNPGAYIRVLCPAAVTGFSFEFGFSDPKTDELLHAVTALTAAAVPTTGNGVTDLACVVLDTDLTLTTAALVGDGTTGSAAGVAIGTFTPTASRYLEIIIQCYANLAACAVWDNGVPQGQFGVTNGPDTGVLLNPYFLSHTRNTTTKQWDIDQIVLWAERNRVS